MKQARSAGTAYFHTTLGGPILVIANLRVALKNCRNEQIFRYKSTLILSTFQKVGVNLSSNYIY